MDVTAPTVARHLVRVLLGGLGLGGQAVDDVLLATSELVTNAFEHGGAPDRLELEYFRGKLMLRVFDSGDGEPELKTPSPELARSRGLYLVNALAEGWGFERRADGKYVWAEFMVPAEDEGPRRKLVG
ncbi:ATP-binding protein [Amycolatopsis sp. H20-H5]|uniref:ATP-binding protein n=1 Tax=Amycolatopsis sp. H20-H5 TaxID=3046309 RepID=UPI003FA3839C